MKLENVEDVYALSATQHGMLYQTLAAPGTGIYFVQYCRIIEGALDVAAFQQAWQHILERHPILRTAFIWEGLDNPVQVVRKKVDVPWHELDWRDLSPEAQRDARTALLRADREK